MSRRGAFRRTYEIWFGLLLFILSTFDAVETLECTKCVDEENVSNCNQLTRCSDNERCFHTVTVNDTRASHTMGCIDSQHCGFQVSNPSIIGRSVQPVRNCHECCSTNLCNEQSCAYDNTCRDDSHTDCARLESLMHFCNDIHHAKLICRDFCKLCNLVDGQWASWAAWSTCSVTCGDGTINRHRSCNNPPPVHGGLTCEGPGSQQTTCNMQPCIVNGGWGGWQGWKTCSATCGDGTSTRIRECNNPSPAHGGLNCTGMKTDHKTCNLAQCPVHGNWSDWTNWSACTSTCGISMQSRARNCDNPPPGPAGHYCVGPNVDHKICNAGTCAAFSASMSSSTTPAFGQTVHFGLETLDIGSGYNPRTNIYTVPLTGVYTFTWTIRIGGSAFYATELVVNNDVKFSLLTYSREDVSTATTVVSVNAGDRVFIRVLERSGSPTIRSASNGRSSFSGWILN